MGIAILTQVLMIAFLACIIILIVVDILHLKSLKKIIKKDNETVSIDKYYELKWRINLFLSITTIVAVVLGFLGFSVKKITTDQYNELNTQIEAIADSIKNRELLIDELTQRLSLTSDKASASAAMLDKINNSVMEIQRNNIQKWEFQFIENVEVDINSQKQVDTIYFKDLKTSDGRKIPEFKETPLVNLIDNDKTNWLLRHTYTHPEYFVIEQRGSVDDNFVLENIDIWILFK